jgi:hypothetical protein
LLRDLWTQYKGKTLYVGLGGGELVTKVGCEEIRDISDDEELALTPVGHLVLDILIALPVECPSLTIAEILDSTAADPDDLLSRVHRILDKAANFSKIMIIGDFTKALDGKVTPLLGIEGVVEVEDLPGYSEDEVV